MNIEIWIRSNSPSIETSIKKHMSRIIEDYNSRNTLNSTASLSDTAYSGYTQLELEIKQLIEGISSLKRINKREWMRIKEELISLSKKQFLSIKTFCKDHIKTEHTIPNIQGHESHVLEMLTFYIEKHIQILKKEYSEKIWDVIKMIISGVIGGIIALAIKNIG